MKRYFLLCAITFYVSCFAQDTKDTADIPERKFSVSVQLGEPNKIHGAEYADENISLFATDSKTTQYGWSAGLTLRKHTSSTFFYHVRVAYSTRYRRQADTSYSAFTSTNSFDGTRTDYVYAQGALSTYRASNLLFALGGGHEMRYRNFIVRAGGELHYLRYMQNGNTVSASAFHSEEKDTLSTGGHYSLIEESTYGYVTKYPCVNATGIIGHASLEYKLNPSFGIGASFFFGGYYVWVRDQKYERSQTDSRHFSDSHQNIIQTSSSTSLEYDYSKRQFEFGPLNAQINLAFYFGK